VSEVFSIYVIRLAAEDGFLLQWWLCVVWSTMS